MAAGHVRRHDPEVMFPGVTSAIAVPFGARAFVDVAISQKREPLPERLRRGHGGSFRAFLANKRGGGSTGRRGIACPGDKCDA
jgi:hypothetical protein